jgi:hypothetical protein
MHIAILMFDGYDALDSLIALGVPRVRSVDGVVIESQVAEEASAADPVIVRCIAKGTSRPAAAARTTSNERCANRPNPHQRMLSDVG